MGPAVRNRGHQQQTNKPMKLITTSRQPLTKPIAGFLRNAALAIALAVAPTVSHAAGLLIADGGFGGALEIKEHDVKVTLNHGVAVTHVTQICARTQPRMRPVTSSSRTSHAAQSTPPGRATAQCIPVPCPIGS